VRRSVTVGRLLVVQWDGVLTLADQQAALDELQKVARDTNASPVMVVLLGEELQPPAADVRKQGTEILRTALAVAKELEVVVGGQGLFGSLQRTTARGIALLMPELRGRVHVHDSLASALARAATVVPVDRDLVSRRLAASGRAA
jgi:hypothetical protein